MTTLYRCPSVRSNRVVTREMLKSEKRIHTHFLPDYLSSDDLLWWYSEEDALEENRLERNKLIAKKSAQISNLARQIKKLSEDY